MSVIKFKANGDPKRGELQDKPGIWFCCHPDDLEKYFESISEDILRLHNCVICYDEEPEADYNEEELFEYLRNMRMIVVPVTKTFLNEKSRARDVELPFAVDNEIHVLPVVMEPNLDAAYKSVFDKMHYLKGYLDSDYLSYESGLERDLDRILGGDDLIEKILAEFSAQIFLSYRKKDDKEAQELMRRIHAGEFCEDIAIWYDKYLFLGEDFAKEILDALSESDLFALAVTPNLLEKSNYVMEEEYPAASEKGKPVLPLLIVPLTQEQYRELEKDYDGIPPCVDSGNGEALAQKLRDYLRQRIQRDREGEDPVHIYYIGMAYLNGIRAEVDHARAVELITRAAEAELPEAMRQLAVMYQNGDGTKIDPDKWIYWEQRLTDYYRKKTVQDAAYRNELCQQLISLALCQTSLHRPEDSVKTSGEAKEMLSTLRSENPQVTEEETEMLYGILNMSMGVAFLTAVQLEDAELYLDEASDTFRRLEELDPEKYGAYAVTCDLSRIILFMTQKVTEIPGLDGDSLSDPVAMKKMIASVESILDGAENLGRRALERARNLPGSIIKEDTIAESVVLLASILVLRQIFIKRRSVFGKGSPRIKRFKKEIENLYREALKIYERLSKSRPNRYDWKIAHTKNNLDSFYLLTGQVDKVQEKRSEKKNPYQYVQASPMQDSWPTPPPWSVDRRIQPASLDMNLSRALFDAIAEEDSISLELHRCLDALDNLHEGNEQREKLLDRALQCYTELDILSGVSDTEKISMMHRLADHLWKQNRCDESAELDSKVLDFQKNVLIDDRFSSVTLPAAVKAMRRICAYDRKKYLPGVSRNLIKIADKAYESCAYSEAEEIYRELISAESDGNDFSLFWALLATYRLAIQKREEKEYDLALSLLQSAVGLCSKDQESIWMNNNNFFVLYSEMAGLHLSLHNTEAAELAYREALSYFKKEYTRRRERREWLDEEGKSVYPSSFYWDAEEDSGSFRMRFLDGEPLDDVKRIHSECKNLVKLLQNDHREEEAVDMLLRLADFISEETEKRRTGGYTGYDTDFNKFLVGILRTDAAEILYGEKQTEDAEKLLGETLDYWLSLSTGAQEEFVHEIEHCYDILSHLLCVEGRENEADEWKKRIQINNIFFPIVKLAENASIWRAESDYREALSYFEKEFSRGLYLNETLHKRASSIYCWDFTSSRMRFLEEEPLKDDEETINTIRSVCKNLAKILQDDHRDKEAVDVFLSLADFISEETEKRPIGHRNDSNKFLVWILRTDAAEILCSEKQTGDAEKLLSETLDNWLSLPAGSQEMYDQEIMRCYDMLSHLLCAEGRRKKAKKLKKRMRKIYED